jgi:2-isopropylmalate synthase
VIRVNSQSGKGGISFLLEGEYGLELPRRLQIEFSRAVQGVMDATGKELSAQDLWGLFETEYRLDQATVAHQLTDAGAQDDEAALEAEVTLERARSWCAGRGTGPSTHS